MHLAPLAVAALSQHQERQSVERVSAGREWVERGQDFSTRKGGPLEPSRVPYAFGKALVAAGGWFVVHGHPMGSIPSAHVYLDAAQPRLQIVLPCHPRKARLE